MSEDKTKRPDHLRELTKKPKTLGSLVAAVGASAIGLLGILPSASADANTSAPKIAVSESTIQSKIGRAKLRLNRVGSKVQLAQDGHDSHSSHASHESHASHASSDYR
jgi:hypothetical protein